MFLGIKKNVRAYDNCLYVCCYDDITDDNRTINHTSYTDTARKEKKTERYQESVSFTTPPIQKDELFRKVTYYTLHLNSQHGQCQINGRDSSRRE